MERVHVIEIVCRLCMPLIHGIHAHTVIITQAEMREGDLETEGFGSLLIWNWCEREQEGHRMCFF